MAEKKGRTFAEAKKKYGINEKVREGSKQFKEIHKKILDVLEECPKTIPQIAKELNMPTHEITYYLMTCRKYGNIAVSGIDNMDEYFLYELEGEK